MDEFRSLARTFRAHGYGPALPPHRSQVQRVRLAAAQARAFVRRYRAAVRAAAGVSPLALGARVFWLHFVRRVTEDMVLDYQLYRPEHFAHAGAYVSSRDHVAFTRVLFTHLLHGPDLLRTRDKATFPGWCAERGLPAAGTIAEWDDGVLVSGRSDAGEVALPAADLFSKPADMMKGHGSARWRYDGAGGWLGRDGRTRDAAALLAEIAETSRTLPSLGTRVSRRMLLMVCLENHPALAPVTNGALCTVRITTFRHPGGPAKFHTATYRMAVGDAPADNYSLGGIMAPVDAGTGRLGHGMRRQNKVVTRVERHPDSGARIHGHQLPDWAAARALALRAHDLAADVPVFSWDVALTPDGPVLLEANFIGGCIIMQAPSARPLGTTPYLRALNAQARAAVTNAAASGGV